MAVEVRHAEAVAGVVSLSGVPGWASPYIGLPFVDGGRDFSGVDCEGLCRLVMQREAGAPPIPAYGTVSADGLLRVAEAIADGSALPPWVSVERTALRKFDWVLMTGREKFFGRPRTVTCHIGVMLSESLVLHIEKATHSVAVPLDHGSIRHRLAGFVRHEALA